jgi:hypothetical protein
LCLSSDVSPLCLHFPRLSKKLDDSQGVQGRLVKIRTAQNIFLMKEMNKLRR